MKVQSRPIGEASPNGCISRSSDGWGNCEGTIFRPPYSIMIRPSPKRT
jgi:hypothetical protein